MARWIFFIIFLTHLNSFAQDVSSLAKNPQWINLIHYKRFLPLSKQLKSQIDAQEFFLSPEGKKNPLKELEATVKAFQDVSSIHNGRFKQHPQCAFPARLSYLKKYFQFPKVECKEFDEWKKQLDIVGVYLVFSTAYPNNPASSFGHTFLRLNLSDNRSDLLDYAVNFAANTEGVENGLLYTLMGLFGGFKGYYSLEKYYLKVNDYNNNESRDLWEYEIDLTDKEKKMLIDHYWELYANSYVDYYFMDENCSYYLLSLLEASRPQVSLTDPFHKPWVFSYTLPGDTVKQVVQEMKIKNVSFRPSKRKTLFQKRDALNEKELSEFYSFIKNPKTPIDNTNSFLLDALIDYYDYKKRDKKLSLESDTQKILSQLLIQRSQLGKTPSRNLNDVDQSNRPDLAHGSESIRFWSGIRNDYALYGVKYKMGLHDLLNSDKGYDLFSQIDFFNLSLGWSDQEDSFFVEEIKYFDISSISPRDPMEWNPSWRVLLQTESLKNSDCMTCLKHLGYFGFGSSHSFFKNKLLFYTYGILYSQYSKDLKKEFQIGPGLESGFLVTLKNYKILSQILLFENLNENKKTKTYDKYSVQVSYQNNPNWDYRLLQEFSPRNDDSNRDDFSIIFSVGKYF